MDCTKPWESVYITIHLPFCKYLSKLFLFFTFNNVSLLVIYLLLSYTFWTLSVSFFVIFFTLWCRKCYLFQYQFWMETSFHSRKLSCLAVKVGVVLSGFPLFPSVLPRKSVPGFSGYSQMTFFCVVFRDSVYVELLLSLYRNHS